MPSPAARQTLPACPRCGYDQSGEVERWTDTCPLDGVCPECGLRFAWREILDPSALLPAWSVERVSRRGMWLNVRSVARSVRPASLWSQLSIAHPVRVTPLLILGLGSFLAMHLFFVLVTLANQQWLGPGWADPVLEVVFWPYGRWLMISGAYTMTSDLTLWWMLPVLVMTAGMLILGTSFRRARVRKALLLRVWAYGTAQAVVLSFVVGNAISAAYWVAYSGTNAFTPTMDRVLNSSGVALSVVYVGWLGVWWWRMLGKFLRLEHPLAVTATMGIIGALVMMILYLHIYTHHFATLFL